MKRYFKFMWHLFVFPVLFCAGCAVTPPPITHQPSTPYVQTAKPHVELNGAIYQTSSYRPLFEDQRARLIGDVLTISINEKTSAGKTNASSGSKTGSTSFKVPALLGVNSAITSNASIQASSANKFDEAGAETASNNFTGTIAVTIIEVFPNGNLLVSGEKKSLLIRAQNLYVFGYRESKHHRCRQYRSVYSSRGRTL